MLCGAGSGCRAEKAQFAECSHSRDHQEEAWASWKGPWEQGWRQGTDTRSGQDGACWAVLGTGQSEAWVSAWTLLCGGFIPEMRRQEEQK